MSEEQKIQKNLKELELKFLNEGNHSLNNSTSENEEEQYKTPVNKLK